MNAGGRLYADGGVDNKPPVIFWIYSAVFRATGLYDLAAVHLLKIAVVLATAAVVGVIAKRLAGPAAGWVAALLYVVFTAAGYPQMAAANTEVFMMLPLAGSFLLMLDGRWFAAGGLIALAALTKQVALTQLLLLPLAAVLWEDRWRPLAGGLLGFAAGLATALVLLSLTGSLSGFWHWTVVALVTSYGPSAWSPDRVPQAVAGGFLPWLGLTPLLTLAAILRLARPRHLERGDRLAAGWLAAALVGALAGGHFFGHYFLALVGPLAILAAPTIVSWRPPVPRPALVVGAMAALLSVPAFVTAVQDYGAPGLRPDPVSLYVAAHTRPGDRIFVWGNAPAVYVFSGRVPSTRFVGFLRGFPRSSEKPPVNWDTAPEVWPQLGEDFALHPAVLVVDTSTEGWNSFGVYSMDRFPVLPGIIRARYRLFTKVAGVALYRLQ